MKVIAIHAFWNSAGAQALAEENDDAGSVPPQLAFSLSLRLETGFPRWLSGLGSLLSAGFVRAHDRAEAARTAEVA